MLKSGFSSQSAGILLVKGEGFEEELLLDDAADDLVEALSDPFSAFVCLSDAGGFGAEDAHVRRVDGAVCIG